MVPIYSLENEKYLLACLLRFPETFSEIDGYIDENDFTNQFHATIFGVIRQTLRNQEKLEKVLVAQKINNLSLSFEDKVNDVLSYVTDLSLIPINHTGIKEIAEELKIITVRREIAETCVHIVDAMKGLNTKEVDRQKVVSIADAMYNEKISIWDSNILIPENICESLPAVLEEKARNPVEQIGAMGPHSFINDLYGSLFRPGNLSVICARAKAGKSSFLLDYAYKCSKMNGDIPCLFFDCGEMTKEEHQMRLASNISGVPLYFLETGKYLSDRDMVLAVEEAKKEIRSRKIYYYSVANKSVDQMLTILKRFYLSKVGRGNDMLFIKDYLKSFSEKTAFNKAEWETFGIMVNKYKDILSTEVPVGMLTAAQTNRFGIVTGKNSSDLNESEESVGGSDRIVMFSSQVFLLRKKTEDELENENSKWGTHNLIPLVTRHLGKNVQRALSYVKMPNGRYKSNHINLDIQGFRVTEKKDLVSTIQSFEKMDIIKKSSEVNI